MKGEQDDTRSTLPVGALIRERYLVKSLLGQGNAGPVYLVEDQRVKRNRQQLFALKEMVGLSKQERYQFTFDCVPLTRLNHTSLPRIHHIFNDDKRSRVCIVMEYVESADEKLFYSLEEFKQALQAPVEQAAPAADEGALLAPTNTSAVTGQLPVPAALPSPSLQRSGSASSLFPYLKRFGVILVLLILAGIAGAGIWSLAQSHQAPMPAPKQAVTAHLMLSPPAPGRTAPAQTPTSSPGVYPGIVGTYTGTLVDVSKKTSATMILQGIHQVGGVINGYLTLGSPLEINGPFSGLMDMSKRFHFTVTDATGHPVLFLEGTIQSTTSLSGDFYRCASLPAGGSKCSRASDGYGIWNALLLSAN